MLWHALPPEVNTARLLAGAGPAPMLQAAAGWEALGSALEAQAVELGTTLVTLQGMWTGAGSERAIAAATPMVAWLQDAASKAQQRAVQASAQATAYMTALASTPTLIEIVINHITHAVLTATNFLGINLMPIGFNEMDYFGRMWMQAAVAMDVYQAETMANTVFEPPMPMKPILVPEVGQAISEAMTGVSQLQAGPAALRQFAAMAAEATEAIPNPMLLDDQTMELLTQLGQLSQQMSGPMQQLLQPIQQFTSMASQGGGMGGGMGGPTPGAPGAAGDPALGQMGLLGANPLSNHPLAGGFGPSAGLGMMHAEALPGAAGSDPRTSLMSQLIDKPTEMATASAGAGAGSSAAGGAAPMGGAMGAGAAGAQSGGGGRSGVAAPAMVAAEQSDDGAHEGFDDEDDW